MCSYYKSINVHPSGIAVPKSHLTSITNSACRHCFRSLALASRKAEELEKWFSSAIRDRAGGATGRVFLCKGLYFLFISGESNGSFFKLLLFQVKEQRVKTAPSQFPFIPLLSGRSRMLLLRMACKKNHTLYTEVAELPAETSEEQEEMIFFLPLLSVLTLTFSHQKLQSTSNIVTPLQREEEAKN